MAGIYIHIPFCRKICSYCDFYKTADISFKPLFINALLKELKLRGNYLCGEKIETIYFGGGTPSVLTPAQINLIIGEIFQQFEVANGVEISFEANPDDLKKNYLEGLKTTKINRLSIGIQSFLNHGLKYMGRRHNGTQAEQAVQNAFSAGFKNISIDLIYGLPGLSLNDWAKNLEKAFNLPVKHVSSYHLTYHKGTKFYELRKKGLLKEIKEKESVQQFEMLVDLAKQKGFVHYEISNFAKDACFSKHNSSYWFGKKYLGLGPSAHSFNQESRQWNVANVQKYMEQVNGAGNYFEVETLSENDKYNDFILTRLRTMWGIPKKEVENKFGAKFLAYLAQNTQKYIQSGHIVEQENNYTLSKKGYFISDEIMANLMFVEA